MRRKPTINISGGNANRMVLALSAEAMRMGGGEIGYAAAIAAMSCALLAYRASVPLEVMLASLRDAYEKWQREEATAGRSS